MASCSIPGAPSRQPIGGTGEAMWPEFWQLDGRNGWEGAKELGVMIHIPYAIYALCPMKWGAVRIL